MAMSLYTKLVRSDKPTFPRDDFIDVDLENIHKEEIVPQVNQHKQQHPLDTPTLQLNTVEDILQEKKGKGTDVFGISQVKIGETVMNGTGMNDIPVEHHHQKLGGQTNMEKHILVYSGR